MPLFTSFMRRVFISLLVAGIFGVLLCAGTARAQTWTEIGDAGELPATAQITSGSGALTEIDGGLSNTSDVDMYCIRVTDPASFRARLGCLVITGPDIRLFNATGVGVSANFLCQAGDKFVSGAFATTAGTYYLAVCYRGREAFAGPNAIWLATNTSEHAPDGPGAAGIVSGWGGTGNVQPINPYQILLTGSTFCDTATPARIGSWGRIKILYH